MNTVAIRALLPQFLQQRINHVLASPIGGRLARGAFWSLLGTTISKGCSTISWIIVGRMLGKESFGELNMVQNTVGLFGAAAGLGMGVAAAKYVSEYKRADPDRAGRFMALASTSTWITSIILAIVMILLAPWLARETLAAPYLAPYLVLSSLLMLLSGVAGAQSGTLAGLEAFKAIATTNIVVGILSFPMLLVGANLGGVTGALWALIASALVNCLLNFIHLRREAIANRITVRFRGCLSEMQVFWDFNLPVVMNTIVAVTSIWIVGTMMVRHTSGFGELGVYNAVVRMKLIPESIAAMLLAPMLPVLSDTFARNDRPAYCKTLALSYILSTVAIIPISLLQIAIPMLTLLPYGNEYAGGEPIVVWMMVSSITYALIWPLGNILVSMGKVWLCLGIALIQYPVQILGTWLLLPTMGAAGAAAAITIGFFAACIPCMPLVREKLMDVLRSVEWLRMFLLTIALIALCSVGAHAPNIGIAASIGAASAFAYAAWRTRGLSGYLYPRPHHAVAS